MKQNVTVSIAPVEGTERFFRVEVNWSQSYRAWEDAEYPNSGGHYEDVEHGGRTTILTHLSLTTAQLVLDGVSNALEAVGYTVTKVDVE